MKIKKSQRKKLLLKCKLKLIKRIKLNLSLRSQLPNQRKNSKRKLRINNRRRKIKRLKMKPRIAKMENPKKIQK
jgi:hypothetical protein